MRLLAFRDPDGGNTRAAPGPISGNNDAKRPASNARFRRFLHGDAARKITRALKAGGADIVAGPTPLLRRPAPGKAPHGGRRLENAKARARTLLTSLRR
jgi:hypothetical protein